MKKLLFVFICLITEMAWAQDDKYFYLGLDINKPLSNTQWINSVSTRGVRGGYRVFINRKFSAGLDVSWNTFDQYHPTETVQYPTGAITTDYFKYLYTYSIAASGQYYFTVGDGDRFLPYAGLGLGATNTEFIKYYNIYKDSQTSWGFLARPEAGIVVKIGPRGSMGVMGAIHYDYATNKSDKFSYKNFSSMGFQIGLVFLN
jgi:hypothetical protein